MNAEQYRYTALPDVTLEMAQKTQCNCQHNSYNTSGHMNHNIKKQEYGLTGVTPEPFSNGKCYSKDAKNILFFLMVASASYLIYKSIKKRK